MLIDTKDLCGTAEAAEVLGVVKQRIHTLRKREDFPKPVVVLAATPLWDGNALLAFKATWKPVASQDTPPQELTTTL